MDAFEWYTGQVFTEGEPVILAEKLDGSNFRAVYWDGRFWVKTRKRWVKRIPDYSHVTVEGLTVQGMPQDKAEGIVANLQKKDKQVNDFWSVMEKTPALMSFFGKESRDDRVR